MHKNDHKFRHTACPGAVTEYKVHSTVSSNSLWVYEKILEGWNMEDCGAIKGKKKHCLLLVAYFQWSERTLKIPKQIHFQKKAIQKLKMRYTCWFPVLYSLPPSCCSAIFHHFLIQCHCIWRANLVLIWRGHLCAYKYTGLNLKCISFPHTHTHSYTSLLSSTATDGLLWKPLRCRSLKSILVRWERETQKAASFFSDECVLRCSAVTFCSSRSPLIISPTQIPGAGSSQSCRFFKSGCSSSTVYVMKVLVSAEWVSSD